MHAAGEAHLCALAAERDVLVQQYLPSVEDHGERALIWIDGAFTHAIRKTPRFEGDAESVSPVAVDISSAEAELAERAMATTMATVDSPLLYGRVDVAPGPHGQPVLMELELIEPSLYFLQSHHALERFLAGICRRLGEIA
jgi:O-ureido-D-serine cyclo-ligase